MRLFFKYCAFVFAIILASLSNNEEVLTAVPTQQASAYIQQTNDASIYIATDFNVEGYIQSQARTNLNLLSRRYTQTVDRKLFVIVAILYARYFSLQQKYMQTSNLAVISKPQTDYYLYTLERMRI
jgi:hypothetical protein